MLYIFMFFVKTFTFSYSRSRPDPIFFNLKTFFPLTLPSATGRILLVAILLRRASRLVETFIIMSSRRLCVFLPLKTVIYYKTNSRSGELRFEIST
jgi:hypothetical protein